MDAEAEVKAMTKNDCELVLWENGKYTVECTGYGTDEHTFAADAWKQALVLCGYEE